MKTLTNKFKNAGLIIALSLGLSACGSLDRISNIGKPPAMSPLVTKETEMSTRPVALPMPPERQAVRTANSLWSDTKRTTFFEDQRANEIGDILTVVIELKEDAEIENETTRERTTAENANLTQLLGLETELSKFLPEAVDPTSLANLGSTTNYKGNGEIGREESVNVRVAAMVSQTLPNGNLIIHGRQELLVNFEKRIIQIDGVIRPEDISVGNTISYDQIAQARIVYGGEGQITDVQQPRYGTQLYDIVFPF